MAVSKRLRYEILRRDQHTCRYCGATAPDVPLRIDHVTPVALGGADTPDNLVTACQDCNSGKSSATVDSTVVADVSDDALRWAAAMEQAAASLQKLEKPKEEYRDAFLAEWNRWHIGKGEKAVELPSDWKLSIERFRVAGIPAWMWANIVDIGMANQKVKAENTFKYCCGVAWNRVDELHAEAGRIVGSDPAPANLDIRASVIETAYTIWHCGLVANEEPPTAEQKSEFRRSLNGLDGLELEAPERIIKAAQFATYFGMSDIATALRDMDRDSAWTAWSTSWPTTYIPSDDPDNPWGGRSIGGPSEQQREWVRGQIEKLLDGGIYINRIIRAASHAGIHKSAHLYLGLSDDELEASGVASWQVRASELWRASYEASEMAEPTEKEKAEFIASLKRIVMDGNFYLADVYEAASAAGSYQDPDVVTCLTRHLSVFEAAALPVGGEN
jgi:hypothetical protein